MLLSVQERLVLISSVLPAQNDFVTLGLIQALKTELFLSQKEVAEFEVKTDMGQTRWNVDKTRDKEIEIGDALKKVIVDALDALDKAKKLGEEHLGLYKKFMLPANE